MRISKLLLASLALGAPAPSPVLSPEIPESVTEAENPAMCLRGSGRYDICDTLHSYVTCAGHEEVLISDCRVSNITYCRVVGGKGSCDGTEPPRLGPHHHNHHNHHNQSRPHHYGSPHM